MVAATSDGLSPVTGTLTTEERILTEREAGPDNNRMSPLSDNQPFNPCSYNCINLNIKVFCLVSQYSKLLSVYSVSRLHKTLRILVS